MAARGVAPAGGAAGVPPVRHRVIWLRTVGELLLFAGGVLLVVALLMGWGPSAGLAGGLVSYAGWLALVLAMPG